MKVSVCILNESENSLNETIDSLKEGKDFIAEIIYAGKKQNNVDEDIKYLNLNTDNKALQRNKLLEEANSDYILWLSDNSQIEEGLLEEFIEVLEETPDAEVIYPHEIVVMENNEQIKNFADLYNNESLVLNDLPLEKNIPEYGVLTKKSIFENLGKFDEDFKEYEFYRFLLLNIKTLKLKLSDLSFVRVKPKTFIDTSYALKTYRDTLNVYSLEKDIFPHLSWDENRELAQSTAYTMIGDALASYHDFYNATDYYRKALISFHNKHTLEKLIKAYVDMGLFENAKQLLSKEQGLSEEEIEKYKSDIEKIEKLISELEKGVEEGKLDEVLYALNDVIQIYQGAPIYNIAGVVQFYKGDIQSAYRFFYKAVIINPLEENILRNLTDIAKQIGKEEEVIALVKRILE